MSSRIENVSIIRMGDLGLMYGSVLADGLGIDAVSFIMDEERIARYKDETYTVNGRPVKFKLVSEKDARPADLLMVAVKYPSLSRALETMKNAIDGHTVVMSVMNGISTEEIIRDHFSHERFIYTVPQGMDAQKYGSTLTFTKMGALHIGVKEGGDKEAMDAVIQLFERTGMPYILEEDIIRRMWIKFMLNVGINQVCMAYNETYAVTDKDNEAHRTLIAAMREVEVLAQAEGIPLNEKDLNFCLDLERTLDPDATPSMGQDRINRKPSEVELFAGTVIALAEKHGIEVPANRYLRSLVKEIEKEYV